MGVVAPEVAVVLAVVMVARQCMVEEVAMAVHPHICLAVDIGVDTVDALAVTTHTEGSLIQERISILSLVPARKQPTKTMTSQQHEWLAMDLALSYF